MKKLTIFGVGLFAVFFAVLVAHAANQSGHEMNMQHGMHDMSAMLKPLESLRGREFDRGFYSMMIPHHEGAVRMSQRILQTTQDPQVKSWAEAIITAQEQEIEEMRRALDGIGGVDENLYRMMDGDMKKMVDGTTSDRSYVDLMIPHHESAVQMAEMAKGRTENPALLKMAGDIVRTQNEEIKAFREWQNEQDKK